MDLNLSNLTMEIFTKLEQQWLSTLPTNNTNTDHKKTKILTIDGAGPTTSAAVAGAFLIHLEDSIQTKTGDVTARIIDYFDIISGTGIGAVLAVFLTAADDHTGRPLFSARNAVEFLTNNHDKIFKQRRRGKFFPTSHRCSSNSLENILRLALKGKTLKDTCKPILVPCYDIMTSSPFVFSRAAASASGWRTLDFELWKVCCAAIATPRVFSPFRVESVDRKTCCMAVDAGLVMNNPASAVITHVMHNKEDFPTVNGVEDLLVLSMGNGTLGCRGSGGKWSGNSGKVVKCVVDVAVDGASDTVDQLLANAFAWNRSDYVRIQANGLDGSGPMTSESVLKERGIESLTFGGKRLLTETNQDRIESFVQRLVSSSTKSSFPPSPYKSLSPLLDGR